MPRARNRLTETVIGVLAALLATLLPPTVEAAPPLVSPSGAGTVVIGPQAMEGNLQIHPGDPLRAGFDFTMPGSHPAATASFYSGYASLLVKCADGSTPPLTIQLPSQTITDPAGSPSWYPSGDQSSSLVYQGALTAPDLCGGGVMNDASGAIFTTTFFSTDTTDKVNFRFHYSDNTSGSWSATVTGAPTPFAKTVTTATLTPTLALGLSGDHALAIPGDTITYTAKVTNSGATLSVGGDFLASDTGSATTTVASYWDDIYTSLDGSNWSPLVGTAATESGYTPTVAPPAASGLTLALTGVAASGVTYPTSGDAILGTSIASGSTAQWHYTATANLSAAQASSLFDPTKVKKIRNSFHLEVSPANPNVAQPAIVNLEFSNLFYGGGASAALTNVKIAIQPPSGSTLQFDSTTTPALATLSSGQSTSVSGAYAVPAAPAKSAAQSDSAYFTTLSTIEGSMLKATATASAAATAGTVNAPAPAPVTTIEHLPIVSITKSGPANIAPGTTETNPLALKNSGGATASALSITDSVPGGGSGTVTGVPATLPPGASASATATFPVPASQLGGSLTDTASLTWQDGNTNPYGPVSSSFTTNVVSPFAGAILTLAPVSTGPNVPGTSQTLTATLLDSNKQPIANQPISFTITGANPKTGTAVTDLNGVATFVYTGFNAGIDTAQASFTAPGVSLASNTSTISWLQALQPVTTTVVQGNFFANPNHSCTFDATPSMQPAFSQTFPDILFDPDPSVVPHDISAVRNGTRPFTDLTVDANGNYNGQIVAQGNGYQAGTDSLFYFWGSFTGSFVINQPGDLTFRILHTDGYIIGVGGAATRVSGDLEGSPPATAPFNGYPVVGAWNTSAEGSSSSGPVTVHFPASGTYPFELDYTACGGGPPFLDLLTETFNAQTSPLSVYLGYADGLRPGGSAFPYPWNGSPNVIYEGGGCCDNGAVRFDNSGSAPITFDQITVDIDGFHYDLWPKNVTLPPGQILILTGTAGENFDTSDRSSTPCNVDNGVIPKVNVTIAGTTTSFLDTGQVLNTGGFDLACLRNETLPWTRIGGGGVTINLPLPPAASLNLTPFSVPNAVQGQSLALTVAALDGAGNPVPNLDVRLQVYGANTQSQNKPTDANGLVTFSYPGNLAGTDSVQASAFVGGLRTLSNQGTIVWTPPGGNTNNPLGASITNASPADGSVITKPVAVDATIAPPSGHVITSWRVFYQAAAGGPQVVVGGGTGAPPSPLGVTFDPTLLADGAYMLTTEATADDGAIQDVSSGITVYGALKLGRYTTTVQDMSVVVSGFQMQVRRTYDSTDTSNGDFGVGWRVDVSNFRTSSNRILGAGGWTQYNKSCVLGLCFTAFKNAAPRFVTVVFPDQHSEIFDFTPAGGTNIFWSCTPGFTSRTSVGSNSTLVPLDDKSCSYTGDGNLYGSSGLYNPQRFQLTTRTGQVLVLDSKLGLVSMTDPDNNRLTVDASGVHSSSGESITYTRDASGRITDITGPLASQHLHYHYFAAPGPNELQYVVDPNGNTFAYTYGSSSGLLTGEVGPDGKPVVTVTYDSSGRAATLAYGSQPAVSVTSDSVNQQQVVVDPNAGLTTIYTYDGLGDVVERDQAFDGITRKTTYAYDSVGRRTLLVDNLQRSWKWTYDASGDILSYTDGAQRTWQFQNYNSLGEFGTLLAPDGSVMYTQTYDSQGHALTKQKPGQAPTIYTYWPNGSIKSVTDPGGRIVNFAYDSAGHLISQSDSLGRATTYTPDAAGEVIAVKDPGGHTVQMAYDGLGQLTQLTDANLQSWTYFRDAYERLQRMQDPLSHSVNYFYDDTGHMNRIVDRDGATTTFGYDVDGRLVQETRPSNDVLTFTYDALGQMVAAADPAAHDDFTYDGVGNLASQVSCGPTATPTTPCAAGAAQPLVTLSYGYNGSNQLTSISGPDGMTSYAYDPNARLSQITDPSHLNFGFTFDSLGQLSAMSRPNGVNDTFTLDASGDLLSRVSSLGSTTISSSQYTPDPVTGRTQQMTDQLGANSYSYLSDGQLQSATHPAGSGLAAEDYTYDAAGNRTSWPGSPAGSVSYDAADRLLSDGTNLYSYDAEGNLTSSAPRSNPTAQTTYDWNTDHQLLAVHLPDSTSVSYKYDALGRRVEVARSSGTSRFVYDLYGDIHSEYDGSNQLIASYVQSLIQDKPLEVTEAGASYYYVPDGRDNIRALTDQSGAVVDTYQYDAFGKQLASGAVHNPFTYQSREYDAATGLYYYRARYYDPRVGRFLSEDPLSRPASYVYADNNPVSLSDPSGKITSETALIYYTDTEGNVTLIAAEQQTLTYTVGVAAPLVIGEASLGPEEVLLTAVIYGPWMFRLIALVVAFGYIALQNCEFNNSVPSPPPPTNTCPSTPPATTSAASSPCGAQDLPDPGGDGTTPTVGPGK